MALINIARFCIFATKNLQNKMIKKSPSKQQTSMFFSLEDTLNQTHPLYILANKINWQEFEEKFKEHYCENIGRPGLPIRLMTGLLILKHVRNLSDESVVEQWSENNYYQYFCGEKEFRAKEPCEASELVHFRKRIGERGIELILKESIRINGDDRFDPDVSIDTTVQEKNITFPTDNKLHRKIITRCIEIVEKENLPLRQSYRRTTKKLGLDQRFRNHPKNKKRAKKADAKIKTIAGRLLRELERNLGENKKYKKEIEIFGKILAQKKEDKHKIYSIHEPEVECISKGKEHKKYEFGNKVSIVITQKTGVIVGAMSFRNEYDGHTLEPALTQAERLLDDKKSIKMAIADRGYRGTAKVKEIEIRTPKPFNEKTMTKYQQKKMKEKFQRRAAIEPVIGHLKRDHRLGRNFYKGLIGDSNNVMLAAMAFNFKRMMRKWESSFLFNFFKSIFQKLFPQNFNLAFLNNAVFIF